jgi:hypothetical protein
VHGEEIVAANVHNDEVVVGEKATTICAGFESMIFYSDRRFGDEIGLILLLHRA